ncbi:class A beta-lactamase [Leifsonia shinshuensis]|uniref:class A beta-lactamase n=1 Tax=Leifsonia shinshuensis TaxID=150026 RepID=UPI001F511D46|nr:class A beta-lactamase [Leifsonia shinshuensis]MCI0158168.1 class A beta-lactamase [Leifsonia shinshuensis]
MMRVKFQLVIPLTIAALLAGCAPTAGGGPSGTSATPPPVTPSASPDARSATAHKELEALESEHGARVGVYAVDTGTGKQLAYRADERFGYASTYKALAAAAVLADPPAGGLDAPVGYTSGQLVAHSPITEQHVETGMTLRELADAAVRYSDNTAGNLLFDALGGPAGFQAALRGLGDTVTSAERVEPALNRLTPGETADTSTPRALATDLRAFALGSALPTGARAQLKTWLVGNTTGDALIRSVAPSDWTVGDKTGSADHGTRNDIAVIWRDTGKPVVLAVLTDHAAADADTDDALVAAAAEAVLRGLGALD